MSYLMRLAVLVVALAFVPAAEAVVMPGDLFISNLDILLDAPGSSIQQYRPGTGLVQSFVLPSTQFAGVALTPSGNIVGTVRKPAGSKSLVVFNPDGSVANTFATPQINVGFGPNDVSVFRDGTFAVNDVFDNQIEFYSSTGTHLQTVNLAAGVSPGGSTIDSNNTLWVGGFNGQLLRFHQSGTLLTTLPVPGVQVAGVAYSATDHTLWVTQRDGNKVTHLSQSGTILGSFTVPVPVGGVEEFDAISVAADGTLYVAGSGSTSILHVSTTGVSLGSIPIVNPDYPFYMTIAPPPAAPTPALQAGDVIFSNLGIAGLIGRTGAGANVEWHRPDGTLVDNFFTNTTQIAGVAVTADGKIVAARRRPSDSKGLTIFNLNGTEAASFATPEVNAAFGPNSVSVFADGTIAVIDITDKQVELYASNGSHLGTINLPATTSPIGSAAGPGNTLWVGDIGGQLIHVNRAGVTLESFNAGHEIGGVAVDQNDNSVWTTQRNGNRVDHFSALGALLGGFNVPIITGGVEEFDAIGLAPDNTLYLAASANGVVFHYDTLGNLLGTFTINAADYPFFMTIVPAQTQATIVPEPATATLGLLALGGLMMRRRRMA